MGVIVLDRCCNTYQRDQAGVWRYPWGDAVPGATDLTLADLVASERHMDDPAPPARTRLVSSEELDRLTEQLAVRQRTGRPALDAGDLIVGMSAPELQPERMLTVGDIAELASVSTETIDGYRHRGGLPPPQASNGRVPLWARPIIDRWLQICTVRDWKRHRHDPGPLQAKSCHSR